MAEQVQLLAGQTWQRAQASRSVPTVRREILEVDEAGDLVRYRLLEYRATSYRDPNPYISRGEHSCSLRAMRNWIAGNGRRRRVSARLVHQAAPKPRRVFQHTELF